VESGLERVYPVSLPKYKDTGSICRLQGAFHQLCETFGADQS